MPPGTLRLDCAVLLSNRESVGLLMPMTPTWPYRTWMYALLQYDKAILKMIASGIYQRREFGFRYLYHEVRVATLPLAAAEALFSAGFRDVDLNTMSQGTPLWLFTGGHGHNETCHACGITPRVNTQLLAWLIDKGARLDSVHPVFLTMPLHILAEQFVINFLCSCHDYWLYKERTDWKNSLSTDSLIAGSTHIPLPRNEEIDDERRLFKAVFEHQATDDCDCYCTVDGCSAISSALKEARPRDDGDPVTVMQLQKRALHEVKAYLSDVKFHRRFFARR
jgi:hypothetical protein